MGKLLLTVPASNVQTRENLLRIRDRVPRSREFIKEPMGIGERMRPNPSFERTHTGKRQLAFISFWANRRLPVRAAQLKR